MIAWLLIGAVVFFVGLWIFDEHMDSRNRIHMGNHWQYWRAEAEERWTPPQHCDAPWNPYRDDIGPRGRVDVTPGGRRDSN